MSILDICIIGFLILGAVVGFNEGFTKSLLSLVSYVLIFFIAFILKNPVSEFLMMNLPFFDFYGYIKGVSVLNIAVYEVIAFGAVFAVLLIVFKVLQLFTTVFEHILALTIILGVPSKILGTILGIIKNYILVFALLFVLSLPNFSDIKFINDSSFRKPILENTPILSSFTSNTMEVFDEFTALKQKYRTTKNSTEFNLETLDLFLKYGIIEPDLVVKLTESDKLHIAGSDELVKKYQKQ